MGRKYLLTLILLLNFVLYASLGLAQANEKVTFNYTSSDRAKAHYNIAVYFAKKGDFKKAIDEFKESFNYDQKNPETIYNLGVAFSRLNQFNEAINWYQKFLSFKPTDSKALFNIATSYQQLNQDKQAITYYNKAIEAEPGLVPAHANLAILYFDSNQKDNFNKELAFLKKADPSIAERIEKAIHPVAIQKR